MQQSPGIRPALAGLLATGLIAGLATAVPVLLARLPGMLGTLPVSPILVAILLGLALSGVARARPAWSPGLDLAATTLLRLAVALIGLRLSVGQLGSLGLQALPMVAGALLCGLGLVGLLGRLAGLGGKLTALLAVGTAICGASAIAATAPALKPRPEETAYALACVALFGLAATLFYPWLLGAWLPDGRQVGLVLGAAIHDTSQVTAAALLFEQTFSDPDVVAAATVTKLLRNVSMLVVIPAVVWWALRGEREAGARPAFPLFILGFLGFAMLRSGGDVLLGAHAGWQAFLDIAAITSAFLFAMAMAAVGMRIQLAALRALGPRPAIVALLAALGMGMVALSIARLVG